MTSDKAGKSYWDSLWASTPRSPVRAPSEFALREDRWLRAALPQVETRGWHVLELGCARSEMLPFLATAHGFIVTGLDYSTVGCEQACQVLAEHGVAGDVVCGDFFTPPERLLGAFDLVTSFGLAEHFEDTAGCIAAFARFVKPGGFLFTSIPNMAGAVGTLQKLFSREIYDKHVPIERSRLERANTDAGLTVLRCEYFMPMNFGVVNIGPRSPTYLARRLGLAALTRISRLVLALEASGVPVPTTATLAPYVNCLARKPAT